MSSIYSWIYTKVMVNLCYKVEPAGCEEGWANERTDGRTEGGMESQMDGWTDWCMDGQMDWRLHGLMDERTDDLMYRWMI